MLGLLKGFGMKLSGNFNLCPNGNRLGLFIAIGTGVGIILGEFIIGNIGVGISIGAAAGIAYSSFSRSE